MPVSETWTVRHTRSCRRAARASTAMRQAGLSFFTTAPMSSPLSIPVVPVTPAASAETGRRAEKSWGMVCTRWRVTRRKSVALGPMASGVTRRLPRPATRTDPCLGRVGRGFQHRGHPPGRPQNLLPLPGQLGQL